MHQMHPITQIYSLAQTSTAGYRVIESFLHYTRRAPKEHTSALDAHIAKEYISSFFSFSATHAASFVSQSLIHASQNEPWRNSATVPATWVLFVDSWALTRKAT